MAKIRDFAITTEAVAVATMVCTMPVHEAGDLLVAFVNKDTNTAFTTPGGWTAQQTQVSAGAAGGVYTKRAASAAETVSFALTTETCCAVVIAVRNCNGTTEGDAISGSAKSGADDSTLPLSGVGITPSHNNCLVLHGLSTDSGGGFNALPPWVNLFAGDAGANSLCVSYTQQKTAAAITAPDHWGGVADDSRGFIIAIRDNGNEEHVDGYIPLSTTPCRQISPMNGSTGVVDKGAWAGVGANVITSVNGRTVTGTAIATTADAGINPYRGCARAAGAASKTAYSSVEINLTATDDITNLNGLIFLTHMNLTPSDYKDQGTASQGGKYVLFGSTSANYRAWLCGGFRSKTEVADARNNCLIEYSTTDTDLVTLGTPNFAALDLMQFGAMGYAAACSMLVNEIYLLNYVTLAGGSPVAPLDLDQLVFVVNNGCGVIPLIQQAGAQATLWTAMKFGGVDPIFFSENLKTFAYPRKADGTTYLDFHVSNDKIGIEFDGQNRGSPGNVDVLHFTNCLFTSPSSYYWRFASTHDVGVDLDFSGSTVVGAAVTLRETVVLLSVTFIDCPSFTQNGAALSFCTFDGTTVQAIEPSYISDSEFLSDGSGHAIEILPSGSPTVTEYVLFNQTYTGYAATDGSTGNEAIYNNSGAVLTLYIFGGDTPTIRNGAGASTILVVSPVITAVTVIDAVTFDPIENARVLVTASDDTGELPFEDVVTISRSGATATVSHTTHGIPSANKVQIKGAAQPEYNGVFTITVLDADSYTYVVSGTPATPATGTILATGVVIDGLTDVNGEISDSRSISLAQPITGRARRASGGTYYKTGSIVGTISATAGLSVTVQLIGDS